MLFEQTLGFIFWRNVYSCMDRAKREIGSEERRILVKILRHQEEPTKSVEQGQIIEDAKDYGMDRPLVEEALQELQRRGVIHKPTNQGYQLTYQ
jgi:DNA replicative helicase MCM subunit Mcm2 (Cdc46/Mcm family)